MIMRPFVMIWCGGRETFCRPNGNVMLLGGDVIVAIPVSASVNPVTRVQVPNVVSRNAYVGFCG